MLGLEKVIGDLRTAGIVGELWIDGSFLTQKIDPDDVDVTLRLMSDAYGKMTVEQKSAISSFVDESTKRNFRCHSFVYVEYPPGHPLYWEGEWRKSYWIRQWGFSRANEMKGIALVSLSSQSGGSA